MIIWLEFLLSVQNLSIALYFLAVFIRRKKQHLCKITSRLYFTQEECVLVRGYHRLSSVRLFSKSHCHLEEVELTSFALSIQHIRSICQ